MLQPLPYPEDPNYETNEIHAGDLLRFFDQLRGQAHHLYALLAEAPESVFWIVQDDEEAFPDEKTFSMRDFQTHAGEFGAEQTFRVYFRAYFFREEWDACVPCWELMDNPFDGEEKSEITNQSELTVPDFESEWLRIFAYICREAILSNAPFRLDADTVCRYGFTLQDIALLEEPLTRFNAKIIAELRAQYDMLAAIDCLHRPEQ